MFKVGSNTKIFETDWNIIIGLGVKCNTMWIQKRADCRYTSSPFDNMETTCGLIQSADLLKNEFADYWETKSDWSLNQYPGSKGIRNNKYFELYYPHFEESWFSDFMNKGQFKEWNRRGSLELTDSIYNGFKKVFGKRQQRLISILKEKNNVLFLRVDSEPSQAKITYQNNQQKHIDYFMDTLTNAYPNSKIGFLYYFINTPKYKRKFESSNFVYFDECPFNDYKNMWDYVVPKLKEVKVKPREEVNGI
tara:strand:+ start:42281 stop:43027 length:747 start_codon:yes stop_codon:yes gene_type:complete